MNDLLAEYVRSGSSDAFRSLVDAHVDTVHSQCLRQLRQPALADDVTQTVFVLLSQKAAKIPASAVLEGWLFTATRYCCANALRTAARRRSAEKRAAFMRNEATTSPESDADLRRQAENMLDDAIAHLGDRDRNALLLRFFQHRTLREVGQAMGVSEDAAKQRVFRAVEKLRSYFGARGLEAPSATVIAWLGLAVKPAGIHVALAAVQGAAAKCAATGSIHASGIFSRLAWSWPKVAAAVMVTGAMSAAVVASVLATSAPSKSPAPHLVQPILADVVPTTQPADQSTPLNALASLRAAIASNDKAAIDECLCNDGTNSARSGLARATIEGEGNLEQLEKIWEEKFKTPMSTPGVSFDMFQGGGGMPKLLDALLKLPGGPEVQLNPDQDTAQVRVSLPPEIFAGTGLDRLEAQARRSGAMLVMDKVDGKWKLNCDRTFNIVAGVARRPGN